MNDPYGNITGFSEPPKKKKAAAKKKNTSKPKKAPKKQTDIFGNQTRLNIPEDDMAESAVALPGSPRKPKRFVTDLPRYMQTKTAEFPKTQLSVEKYNRSSKVLAKYQLTRLILQLSNVDYDVSDIVNYVVENDLYGRDFINHITKYNVVLSNASASNFKTLIFAIRSQQLTGPILEKAVNDNIVNFPVDLIEYDQNTFELEIRLVGMRTMRRPNRPMKPIGASLPKTEIVNYQLNMQLPIVDNMIDVDENIVDSQQDQIQQEYLSKDRSTGFLKIMNHITELVEPVVKINPDLERQRLQIIQSLNKKNKVKHDRRQQSEPESEPESEQYENDYLEESDEGFNPSNCRTCGKNIPRDVSLKTMRFENEKVITDEFCSIEPCFVESEYKYKKNKK